jgi:hypothetical protein
MTGPAIPMSSSTAVSEAEDGVSTGKRSSSERYELTAESESAPRSDDRLGHEGKAHDALIPIAMEKDDFRGVISSNVSLGEGGGGGGGSEEGEGEDRVLLLKL